jgi:nucleoside-specific outer membrane channel protein Tsx
VRERQQQQQKQQQQQQQWRLPPGLDWTVPGFLSLLSLYNSENKAWKKKLNRINTKTWQDEAVWLIWLTWLTSVSGAFAFEGLVVLFVNCMMRG